MGNFLDGAANPYAPGAGTRPPVLAGRDTDLDALDRLMQRVSLGYADSPRLLEGVRGVGKTVLLLSMRDRTRRSGGVAVHVQARRHEGALVALAAGLEAELTRGRLLGHAVDIAKSAIASLAVSAAGTTVSVSGRSARPDARDLVGELLATLTALARMDVGVLLTIDELQEMPAPELSVLLVALQRAAGDGVPVAVVAAGLPGTLATAARVESFAERMFVVSPLGPLPLDAATRAITEPAAELGVEWSGDGVDHVTAEAAGYPYFLQHFGASTWDNASGSPISGADARRGVARSEESLERSLVAARMDRISDRERAYLHAMAALGPGPHRSGAVASQMGTTSDRIGSARQRLIEAGLVYTPSFGFVAFTVPLFDRLIRRRER